MLRGPIRRLAGHLRRQLIAYMALFVSLGGTAYAVNTVGSADVIDDSLTSADIQNYAASCPIPTECTASGGLRTEDLQPGSVTTSRLAAGAVSRDKIQANAINSPLIENNSVTSNKIPTSAIGNTDLALGAVNSGTIQDGTVQSVDIADGAIGASELGDFTVFSAQLEDGGVVADKLGSIRTFKFEEIKRTDSHRPFVQTVASCPSGGRLLSGGGGAVSGARHELVGYQSFPDGGAWVVNATWDAGTFPSTSQYRVFMNIRCLMP